MFPFVFIVLAPLVLADTQLACVNSIGSTSLQGTSLYQSAAACRSSCGSGYPYIGFKNGNQCYCLQEFPQTETADSCNVVCSGYGQDMCGGSTDYSIYVGDGSGSISTPQAAQAVLGNDSSGSSSSTTTSTSSKTNTGTAGSNPSTSSSSSTSTSSHSADPNTSGASGSDSSSDATTTVVKTTTTASSTETGSSTSDTANSTSNNTNQSKNNTGAIVGGVVGGLAGLAIISAAIFFFCRRRNDDDDEKDLLDRSNTTKSKKNVLDMPINNPFDHPHDLLTERSNSTKLTDPRLNPVMMGRKRLSEGSLADGEDYSRKILHVANPEY